jgi:hypothetical protein
VFGGDGGWIGPGTGGGCGNLQEAKLRASITRTQRKKTDRSTEAVNDAALLLSSL